MSFGAVASQTSEDLTRVSDYLDKKIGAIISIPGSKNKGIAGWVFDIPTGESVDLSSDISEHYTESGSFVNDHVVLKPIRITLSGFIGELVFRVPQPGSAEYALEQIQNRLLIVNSYLGPLSQGATQKAAAIVAKAAYIFNQAQAMAKRAQNLVGMFSGADTGESAQTKAYLELVALWASKQILNVQTPWALFSSMIIETVSAKQDDQANDYSDISITLKEIRFANVQTVSFDNNLFPPASSAQGAPTTSNGISSGAPVKSLLKTMVTGGSLF